jgi:hypothetical protein
MTAAVIVFLWLPVAPTLAAARLAAALQQRGGPRDRLLERAERRDGRGDNRAGWRRSTVSSRRLEVGF